MSYIHLNTSQDTYSGEFNVNVSNVRAISELDKTFGLEVPTLDNRGLKPRGGPTREPRP